jgi:type II secretory pathway component PulK
MIRSDVRRAGFTLITVLWLVTLLSAVVALGLARVRLEYQATANRITLTRAHWAAYACIGIAQARWRQGRAFDTTNIDLGRATFCRSRLVDPTTRLNINVAPRELLATFVGDSAARLIVARRRGGPIFDLHELTDDSELFEQMLELLTVDGPGTINANGASGRVLAVLPGLTPEAVERLLTDRIRSPPRSLDDLLAVLSPPASAALTAHHGDLTRMLTFAPPQLILTAAGWVGDDPAQLAVTIEQLVVPLPDRLAVVRQRLRT